MWLQVSPSCPTPSSASINRTRRYGRVQSIVRVVGRVVVDPLGPVVYVQVEAQLLPNLRRTDGDECDSHAVRQERPPPSPSSQKGQPNDRVSTMRDGVGLWKLALALFVL